MVSGTDVAYPPAMYAGISSVLLSIFTTTWLAQSSGLDSAKFDSAAEPSAPDNVDSGVPLKVEPSPGEEWARGPRSFESSRARESYLVWRMGRYSTIFKTVPRGSARWGLHSFPMA